MNGKNPFKQWQISELTRYLEKNREDPLLDSKTVFLANPRQKIELDRIIKEELWPTVINELAGNPIQVHDVKDGFPSSDIDDDNNVYTCRSLTFVLEDTNRRLSPGSGPPWYCRGHLKCSPMDYMVSFDFSVYLPANFILRRILRLLGDPMFAGNPPNLSIERGIGEENVFVIAFSEGSGAGWGIRSHEQAAEHLRKKVRENLGVIKAVYDLEKDYKSSKNFKALQTALREAYQSY
jgi:hypothetical protein